MPYDLVIRNGTVVDGSGRPRYRADVGVCGGRTVVNGQVLLRDGEHTGTFPGRVLRPFVGPE